MNLFQKSEWFEKMLSSGFRASGYVATVTLLVGLMLAWILTVPLFRVGVHLSDFYHARLAARAIRRSGVQTKKPRFSLDRAWRRASLNRRHRGEVKCGSGRLRQQISGKMQNPPGIPCKNQFAHCSYFKNGHKNAAKDEFFNWHAFS